MLPALGGFLPRRLGDDDGIAFGRAGLRFQPQALAMFHEPIGARSHVGAMLGLGGDATETNVVTKLVHEPRLMFVQIIQNLLHALQYSGRGAKAKQIATGSVESDHTCPALTSSSVS
jgi:hypothetical protein